MIITAFYNLENMPQWLITCIALDRKGWDARGGAATEVAKRTGCLSEFCGTVFSIGDH